VPGTGNVLREGASLTRDCLKHQFRKTLLKLIGHLSESRSGRSSIAMYRFAWEAIIPRSRLSCADRTALNATFEGAGRSVLEPLPPLSRLAG
jgi:hypothetical protein